jgi:hypothetical protein
MNEVFTLARLARRIGVPATWLRAEADAGRIPCLRAGKRYLFDLATVQRELSDRAAKTRQEVSHVR